MGSAGAARGRLVVCSGERRDQRSGQQAKAEKRTDRHLEKDVVERMECEFLLDDGCNRDECLQLYILLYTALAYLKTAG